MPLDTQLKQLLDSIPNGGDGMRHLDPVTARKMFDSLVGAGGTGPEMAFVDDRTIPGPGGDIPIRVYHPTGAEVLPGVVYFHGGGFTIGSIATHDVSCREIASGAGAVVVSVDYRLAPEDRFPAAAEDCYAATAWVHEHAAELGVDPDRLAVGGDSAGGNLAAVTSLLAKERGGPPLRFQLLIYPVVDCTMSHPSIKENGEGYLLTSADMKWFHDNYVGSGDPRHPHASPIFADDLSGLPPAFVITAEYDPLRDEGEAYAERLREAGVPVNTIRYAGMVHGFCGMTAMIPAAKEAMDAAADAVREALTE